MNIKVSEVCRITRTYLLNTCTHFHDFYCKTVTQNWHILMFQYLNLKLQYTALLQLGHDCFITDWMLFHLGWQRRPTTSSRERWTLLLSRNHQLGYWLCWGQPPWCLHTYFQICPLDPWECHIIKWMNCNMKTICWFETTNDTTS